jgi:hypothetical protein
MTTAFSEYSRAQRDPQIGKESNLCGFHAGKRKSDVEGRTGESFEEMERSLTFGIDKKGFEKFDQDASMK